MDAHHRAAKHSSESYILAEYDRCVIPHQSVTAQRRAIGSESQIYRCDRQPPTSTRLGPPGTCSSCASRALQ